MAKAEVELKMKYDAKGDVLYFSLGDAREAISSEVEDGVIIRTDPQTDEVVGIAVIDLSKRFTDHPDKVLSLPFSQLQMAHQ